MKNTLMTLLNWLNDDIKTAPRDGDRVMLGWKDLNPTHSPYPFGRVEIATYVLAFLVAFPVLAFAIEIPVLKSDIQRGERITPEDVYYKDMGDIRINDRALLVADDIADMEATRTIRAGRPVMSNYVRQVPTVRKGEVVALRYELEGLSLTAQGRILEDALTGDMVKLVNVDSNQQLYGRVRAGGWVDIQ